MNISTLKTIARRSLSLAGVASIAAMVLPGVAAAAPTGQLTIRSATLTNSKVNGPTAVTISTRDAISGTTITNVKISFCTTPSYGADATCIAPGGFNATGTTVSGATGTYTGEGTPVVTGAGFNIVNLSGGTGVTSSVANSAITLSVLTNP